MASSVVPHARNETRQPGKSAELEKSSDPMMYIGHGTVA